MQYVFAGTDGEWSNTVPTAGGLLETMKTPIRFSVPVPVADIKREQ